MLNKFLQAAAGNAAEPLFVESVFSTYLYAGNGSTQTITNGIDLSGEGGLVWIKRRDNIGNHGLFSSNFGDPPASYLISNSTGGASGSSSIVDLLSTGFSVNGAIGDFGVNTATYASWTFRKAEKFFDIVTYTGNGTAGRQIAHNLGSVPGCIIVKVVTSPSIGSSDWVVYHRSLGATKYLFMNTTGAGGTSSGFWNNTEPTATHFTLGTAQDVNKGDGTTYVAYLFAHDAGGFGDDGTENVISCGSYTGTGSAGNTITLGYEPQWVMIKRTDSADYWYIIDTMRGFPVGSTDANLFANTSGAEDVSTIGNPTATGFSLDTTGAPNASGATYIYIAIRRPMKTPEAGTEVFAVAPRSNTASADYAFVSNFPVDMGMARNVIAATEMNLGSRMTGDYYLQTPNTNAEATVSSWGGWDSMNSASLGFSKSAEFPVEKYAWMFKRATGFFDVVAYTGSSQDTVVLDGISWKQQPHNLGVAPEFIIVKSRSTTYNWWVFHKDLPDYNTQNRYVAQLNSVNAAIVSNIFGGDSTSSSEPNANYWYMPAGTQVNASGQTFIAYLFATVAGVSKVGSYTGNGSNQTINCGFSSGARFVLIKRSDSTGDWYVWDSARGIVAGNDPHLSLNSSAAEVTTDDTIDPDSSGFIVNQDAATNVNVSSATYIYLAIA